jgi:hypothetical protein
VTNRLSNFDLVSQLHAFMVAVPALWNWDQLAALHACDESHDEHRGSLDGRFIQFWLRVLENDVKEGRRYLHVAVEVIEADRPSGQPGSSTTPLHSSFLLFADGETDMPQASDIYRHTFTASNKALEQMRNG